MENAAVTVIFKGAFVHFLYTCWQPDLFENWFISKCRGTDGLAALVYADSFETVAVFKGSADYLGAAVNGDAFQTAAVAESL